MKILVLRSAGRAGRPADALAISTAPVDTNVSLSRRATMRAWTLSTVLSSARSSRRVRTPKQLLIKLRAQATD
jgi:hypothetical protein